MSVKPYSPYPYKLNWKKHKYIKKGLEPNSTPNNRKNSLYWTISELFCSKILLNYFCVFCFFVHLGHPNTIFSVIS